MENAVTQEIAPGDEWDKHFTDNYRYWLYAADEFFGQKLREEDLVLVRGHTKIRSRWVAVTVHGSGEFTLEVNKWNGTTINAKQELSTEIKFGSVSAMNAARMIYERQLADGLTPGPFIERRYTLLVKYYMMKKRIWGSPRVTSNV